MKKVIALSIFGLALLTGCSGGTNTTIVESANEGNVRMVPLESADTAIWTTNIEDGEIYQKAGDLLIHDRTLTVIFSGSSSCPPVIKSANLEDGMITFTLKKSDNEKRACTADLRPVGWKAELTEAEAGRLSAGRLVSDEGISPLSFTRIAPEQQLKPAEGR